MSSSEDKVGRREFCKKAPTASYRNGRSEFYALSYSASLELTTASPSGTSASASRGSELDRMVAQLSKSKNVQMTAVCDLWTVNRERAVAANQKAYGTAPRALLVPNKLLQLKDLDAVIISTPEHSHSAAAQMAIDAGKDVYSEKPMGQCLGRSKSRPRRRVEEQADRPDWHPASQRSVPARHPRFIRTGALGDVTKYEVEWNYHGPAGEGAGSPSRSARKTRIGPYGL